MSLTDFFLNLFTPIMALAFTAECWGYAIPLGRTPAEKRWVRAYALLCLGWLALWGLHGVGVIDMRPTLGYGWLVNVPALHLLLILFYCDRWHERRQRARTKSS